MLFSIVLELFVCSHLLLDVLLSDGEWDVHGSGLGTEDRHLMGRDEHIHGLVQTGRLGPEIKLRHNVHKPN